MEDAKEANRTFAATDSCAITSDPTTVATMEDNHDDNNSRACSISDNNKRRPTDISMKTSRKRTTAPLTTRTY